MSQDVKKMMQDMHDRIREVAYLMWESAGRQHGMATEYWHAAEREVCQTLEAASEKINQAVAASQPEQKPAAPAAKSEVKSDPAPKPAVAAAQAPAKPEPKPAEPIAKASPAPTPEPAPPAATAPAKPAAKPAAPAATAPAKPAAKPAAPVAKVATPASTYKVEEIDGIGPTYAKKLAAVGIETADHLLAQCGNAEGRAAVAKKTGITDKMLAKWTSMAG